MLLMSSVVSFQCQCGRVSWSFELEWDVLVGVSSWSGRVDG